jgi:hypothetical protein
MRLEESLSIKKIIKEYYKNNNHFNYAINLGSGNIEGLKKTKPWVHKNIFNTLVVSGSKILHVDIKDIRGIDIIQDLSLPNSLDFCDQLSGSKLFILANVLEHIPKKFHSDFLNRIYAKMAATDGLIISAPYKYPYHKDPIDNMYRPNPDQLKTLLPLKWIASEIVTAGSYQEQFLKLKLTKKIIKLLRPLWIFQKPSKYLENHRLIYIFRKFKISIVFGIK